MLAGASQPPTGMREKRSPISPSVGIGLRHAHQREILHRRPDVGWLEVHTENYFGGGPRARALSVLREDYPLSLHGVGLSLGSAEGIDARHLARVGEAIARYEPALVSEHLSWSVAGGSYLGDLLPLPLTEEALALVCRNVGLVQDRLRRSILIENPSSYVEFAASAIPEAEFLAELARKTGCGILCDVNNIAVSAFNHGWDPAAYLAALPRRAIGEIHLAGHSIRTLSGGRALRLDDHGSQVSGEVWRLYDEALVLFGPVPTLIEWDTNLPPLDILLGEAAEAGRRLAAVSDGVAVHAA